MLYAISVLIMACIATGLYFRKRNRRVHVTLMITAFVSDVALVLYIELTRKAVEKVAASNRPLIWVHASISLAVIACYVWMILLGTQLFKGREASRGWHRNVGITFCMLRGLNFVTSLML